MLLNSTFDSKLKPLSFLKFQADTIFTGVEALSSNHVLVCDKKGKIIDIVDEQIAGDDIQMHTGIISPGLINCHCHLELSHLKNIIPEQTGLVDFVLNIIQKRNAKDETIQQAIEEAEAEMIENGIVAVGDICNTTHTLQQKLKNNLYYHNFIEISGFVPSKANERFGEGMKLYHSFHQNFLNQTSLVPHAAYSVSENLFKLIDEQSSNQILSIHNQESEAENDFFINKSGDFLRLYQQLGIDLSFFHPTKQNSLAFALPYLNRADKVLLVHDVFTSKNDLELIKNYSLKSKTQFYLCCCVLANRYISNSIPVDYIFQNNLDNIVIGTDSLASNHSLNILSEIKSIKQAYPLLSEFKLLQCATYNGAVALNIEHQFGSLQKGKQPGIILIENLKTCTKPKKLV